MACPGLLSVKKMGITFLLLPTILAIGTSLATMWIKSFVNTGEHSAHPPTKEKEQFQESVSTLRKLVESRQLEITRYKSW